MVEAVGDTVVTGVDHVPSRDHEAARGQGRKLVHLEAPHGLARAQGQCQVLEVVRDRGHQMKAHGHQLKDIITDETVDAKRRIGKL